MGDTTRISVVKDFDRGVWGIQPQFDAAEDFEHGLAWLKQDGLWGVIDKEGKWVMKPRLKPNSVQPTKVAFERRGR